MTGQTPIAPRVVNDTALVQEPADAFSGSSLMPMLVVGLVLCLVGMVAAVMWS
jgi:hypothetical protein